ncbi:hypothetical protein HCCG_00175 [Helicobacter cinaedi CCUG 18818 = ATCC BAA-847]|uniref:Uncharacterized protein n=1 Tax=Helicobacter cinaedi CCUG 18818 = ATCC BAA-847 TaxID=537971 RepID=A0ABN0B8A9_9HELI|nr:hypothetical protein HCCG_00175 [Helicobacter cinaedi CCUG 18818 = ATCC BAA-847]
MKSIHSLNLLNNHSKQKPHFNTLSIIKTPKYIAFKLSVCDFRYNRRAF